MAAKRFSLRLLAFPLFLVALVALFWVFRSQLLGLVGDREGLRSTILGLGQYGRLAFIGLQALQVIVFMLPGEIVQVAGGYIFGFWPGSLLSLAGITLGSLFNFYVGRLLGRPFVEAVFKKERIESLERISGSPRGAAGFFLFFLVPGIPKDSLCYVAGMTRLGLPLFMAISMGGRLPGILGSSFMGSATHDGSYTAALVVLGLASLLFLAGLVWKDKIAALIEKRFGKG